MRVLFFDDEEIRLRALKNKSEGALIDWAKDVAQAKASLTEDVYDVVCLDHDIGGQMLACTENCGCVVASFIKTLPSARRPMLIVIHSFNPDAATKMMGMLDGEGMWDVVRARAGTFHFKDKGMFIA